MVDASVAIKWVVSEPGTAEALALTNSRLIAPALWRAECANILWKKVKRNELTPQEAELAADLLSRFGVEAANDAEPELSRVLRLALHLDRPAYDCVYLALAVARGIPLVTADRRLVELGKIHSGSEGALQGIEVIPLIANSPRLSEKPSI